MTNQLLVDQVILVHQELICAGPLIRQGELEGAVAAPYQHVFGVELYPTVVLKATKLIEGISRAQAFQDGNKRLAWLSGMILLEINGLYLQEIRQEEAAQFVLDLAADEAALKDGAHWLNERLTTLE